jgi:hypothetical protein
VRSHSTACVPALRMISVPCLFFCALTDLRCCAQGSLSSPFAPKIRITKTGEKFPPHGYDPSAAPGVMVTNTTRRNGQVHVTRRAGKPIVVSRRDKDCGRAARCVEVVRMWGRIKEVQQGRIIVPP